MDLQTLGKVEQIAIEMQQIYYANEDYMDKYFKGEQLGLDNIVDNLCFYDLSYFIETKDEKANEYLKDMISFFEEVSKLADSRGYGMGAMMRGFDVTRPIGRYWTLSQQALSLLR